MPILQPHTREHFFKYCGIGATKAILKDSKLKWSSPLLFNDPFDNQLEVLINPDVDLMAKQSLDHFIETIHSNNPLVGLDPNLKFMTLILRAAVQKGLKISDKEYKELEAASREGTVNALAKMPEINKEIKALLSDTSIFCVTEENDNKLMWSHYADQHQGSVLKFLATTENSPFSVAQKVNYVDMIPAFEAKDFLDPMTMPEKAFRLITLTKGMEWAYEKEWRIVASMRDPKNTYELLPFAKDELSAIYIGARMKEEDQKEIIDLCQKNFPHVEIWKASLLTSRLTIEFSKI